jgi:DNA primase
MGNQRDARRAAALRVFALPPPPPPPDETWKPMVKLLLPAVDVPAARRYLAQRGITTETAAICKVCYSPDWYGRPAVCFPVRDRAGVLVAAHARYIDGRTEPKCRTAGDLRLGTYATPGAFEAPRLVVCEAPIDALSLFQVGVPAVALCGTSEPAWLPTVAAFRQVVMAFDADAAGDAAAAKLAPVLRSFGATVERWRPPAPAKDWNELLIDQGKDALRTALPVYCPPSL